jgi:Protein of unknown function (DUF1549)/Protein of unknown function (DUF1553)
MATRRDPKTEMLDLLDALCEERLTHEQALRLERLVLKDRGARRLYVQYLDLHGSLLWDAAQTDGATPPPLPWEAAARGVAPAAGSDASSRRRRMAWALTASAAAALLVLASVAAWFRPAQQPGGTGVAVAPTAPSHAGPTYDVPGTAPPHYRPVRLDRAVASAQPAPPIVAPQPESPVELPADIVAYVDARVADNWRDAGLEPSPRSEDSEWLRRVYLDLAGRIPSADQVEAFLADTAADKRGRVADDLLASPDFDRHFATVWTNLLVGRAEPQIGDRPGLFAFLRRSFAENQPWDETVTAFVAAEGPIDADPAANFLVAHLNNQAVPATAVTARVFLGTQVQCMQCHNHPFNDWTQQDFWELNSFFQQTALTRNDKGVPVLASNEVGGPTLFETRGGLMKAAYPKYEGRQIPDSPSVDRRAALAKLLAEGDRPQIAVAFVNRVWAHLLGAGFVNPVDDMGPHNSPSHPEALDRLARAFAASDYDVKKLVKWITSTQAYHLTSRFGASNGDDEPATGATPLFSRAYVKPMTVEQAYDSLVVATRTDLPSSASLSERDAWVRQFVRTYETDENDESVAFTGTVPAALALMNGDAVRESLQAAPGTTVHAAIAAPGDETVKLRRLALATLGRPLAPKESAALRRLVRQTVASAPPGRRQEAATEAYQDALWAMLNSAEFVTVP